MMEMRLAMVLTVFMVALGFAPGSAVAGTLVVDALNPDLECPGAGYASIGAAVAAAEPGDVVAVCPGIYNESLAIGKPLTLQGSGPAPEARSSDPRRESIVVAEDNAAFSLAADHITVEGFTIEGSGNTNTGITTSGAFSGYIVRSNLFRRNYWDLFPETSGEFETLVIGNAFNNKFDTNASLSVFPITSYLLSNARFEHNLFTKHRNYTGVSVNLSEPRGVVFSHNSLIDDQEVGITGGAGLFVSRNRSLQSATSGIRVFGSRDVDLTYNYIDGASGAGLVAGDVEPGERFLIAHNTLVRNSLNGVSVVRSTGVNVTDNVVGSSGQAGVRFAFGTGNIARANTSVANRTGILITQEIGSRVEHNTVFGNAENGVEIIDGDGIYVRSNTSSANGSNGFLLTTTKASWIFSNLGLLNGIDGIRAEPSSADNQITGNRMLSNREHDCHDGSVGGATAGTANTWLANIGRTTNTTGLCLHAKS